MKHTCDHTQIRILHKAFPTHIVSQTNIYSTVKTSQSVADKNKNMWRKE